MSDRKIKQLYSSYKARAKKKGIGFELDYTIFEMRVVAQPCYICDKYPDPSNNDYNGVDRIVNDFMYCRSNTASCCWTCNRMKNDMPTEKFKNYLKRLKVNLHERNASLIEKAELCKKYNVGDVTEAAFIQLSEKRNGKYNKFSKSIATGSFRRKQKEEINEDSNHW